MGLLSTNCEVHGNGSLGMVPGEVAVSSEANEGGRRLDGKTCVCVTERTAVRLRHWRRTARTRRQFKLKFRMRLRVVKCGYAWGRSAPGSGFSPIVTPKGPGCHCRSHDHSSSTQIAKLFATTEKKLGLQPNASPEPRQFLFDDAWRLVWLPTLEGAKAGQSRHALWGWLSLKRARDRAL